MSLQVRLNSLISAIGADIKALQNQVASSGASTLSVWRLGDPAPALPLPTGSKWQIQIGPTSEIPLWVPVGSTIMRSPAWGS